MYTRIYIYIYIEAWQTSAAGGRKTRGSCSGGAGRDPGVRLCITRGSKYPMTRSLLGDLKGYIGMYRDI